MVRLHHLLLFVLASLLLTSCAHPEVYTPKLREAHTLIEQNPDSSFALLRQIDASQLLLADWYDYALIQAQAALAADAVPDAELVHQAAARRRRSSADATEVATYYYYATLSYETIGDLDAAIADCLDGIQCFRVDEKAEVKDQLYLQLRHLVISRSEAEWIDMQQKLLEGNNLQTILPAFVLAITLAMSAATIGTIRTRRTTREVEHLQAELQRLQVQQSDTPASSPALDAKSLSLHLQIFQKSDAYLDLQHLKYMRDQIVSINNRTRLMQAVEEAFASDINALMKKSPDLSKEDVFLCLMSLMNFSTHDVASCLGVSDDAIRKRRSRLRQKIGSTECSIFNV